MRACYFHKKTERSLRADVILHSYMSQTITTAAKLAAAFTSLSPDVSASDVSPWISSFILFPLQVLLEVPNTHKNDLGQAAYAVRALTSLCAVKG